MTRDQYLKTKSALTHIDDALREGRLTPEQRAAFAALSVELSKQLVTTWVPAGWLRRSAMLSLFVVGGYGFLAENPDFVEICQSHGLRFIGPSVPVRIAGSSFE